MGLSKTPAVPDRPVHHRYHDDDVAAQTESVAMPQISNLS